MNFLQVKAQLDQIYLRLIETGVSVKQNFPQFDEKSQIIGHLKGTGVALRAAAYHKIYIDLESNDSYHIKLPDGGLLLFQYTFDKNMTLTKHRLAYFPSPALPTIDEAPELYDHDEIYGDILLDGLVRFPIRFDYDPKNYEQRYHPKSHLTLGQFENCRIPVISAVSPNTFLLFILQNFYFRLFRRHQNKFEKKIAHCDKIDSLTIFESTIPYLSF
jgi:hypothetical protein